MQSLMRALCATSMLLVGSGCASFGGTIYAARTACSSLLPSDWKKGVEDAPDPSPAPNLPLDASLQQQLEQAQAVLKEWTGFGVAEAGQLRKANGRTADAIGIVERCEARDAAAVKHSRGLFARIFGGN